MTKIKTLKVRYPGKLPADFTNMLKVGYDPIIDETTVIIDTVVYDSFCDFIREVIVNGEIVPAKDM